MQRVIVALAVIASINIIALQLFMSGNVGPLAKFMPLEVATMITALFIVILDMILVFWLVTMRMPGQTPNSEFDALFRKHYNGANFNEAFEKARKEFWQRLR